MNPCENEVFRSTVEKTKNIHASAADLLRTVLEQKISTGAIVRSSHQRCSAKKLFFKMSQNSQEPPVNFGKLLRASFLKNNSGRLLLKCGHCNNEAKEIDRLCCRELDAMLYLLQLKSQSAREASHHPAFIGISPTVSYTHQSYLPDR